MIPRDIERLIQQGEGLDIEFKKAKNDLPSDLFETVCAFLNRAGGHILLGVKDNGTIVGVSPEHADRLKREFTTLSNNANKLNPPFLLEFTEVALDEKIVLYAYVPESSQVHRCNNIVYDRSHEGDFKVSDDANIRQIYTRKSGLYSESRIYSHLAITDFRPGIIERVRQLIRSRSASHLWLTLTDTELLQSAGLYRKDFQTGEEGYTLAAALLLGKDDVIQSILPHYRIDAILRRVDTDRYDDRIDIRTNLIDAYDLLMAFVDKHLPDKFFLEGSQRVDLRNIIFREIVANLIVHREYSNATPAKFIIYSDRVETENANKPKGFGPIDPERFSPYPKNPTLAKFFVQLGRVEELGSGIRNVTRLVRFYAPNQTAQFIEEDVFRAIVPVPGLGKSISGPDVNGPLAKELGKVVNSLPIQEPVRERLLKELSIFMNNQALSVSKMSSLTGFSPRTIRRDFAALIKAGVIRQSDSFGFYELVKSTH
ncbi:putative DNA binding domain-containing protein [Pontibacter sp. BT731]|uniref:RNA-binding domain-containing protein n=1 Tax=Pontibacter coccineus TaxID=3063328 RepID=UPI0026E38432|nr:RNA-binding domain-containing protein [Pontibacter sp. BT731]MDO6389567.1 putative DNA binding domain-containing protein [Pontibacter sp. BT731]